MTHSGLQLGGGPMYPGRQEQASWPFITWQTALAPHGDGWHGTGIGVITGITVGGKEQKRPNQKYAENKISREF